MTGYSLHIGLNHVDPDAYNGWDGKLAGCVNDATSMRELAVAQGFEPTSLIDEQATSQAVVGELNWMAMRATAGDICLITYSGHGGQVPDRNDDEIDLQDETWVCFDRQVLDDELAQMWSQFEAGVRIVVVSDSCHSGTVVRADLMQDPAPRRMPPEVQDQDNRARRGTYQFVQALAGTRNARATSAAVILLAGCQDRQLSYDGSVNGAFTGALLRVWADGGFGGDHRAFVDAITRLLPAEQIPNLDLAGAQDAAFLAQRPFTVAAPSGQEPEPGPGEPEPEPEPRPVLRRGDSGPEVRELQQLLADLGYSITVDGAFGYGTERSVRSFQRSYGLVADGVVGPATWEALEG